MRGRTPPEKAPHAASRDASREASAALGLIAAFGLAVAQPLYQLFAAYPAFLVAHRLEGLDRVLLAVGLSVLLPLAVWLVSTGFRAVHDGLGRRLDAFAIGIVLALMPLQWIRAGSVATGPRLVLLALGALLFAGLYLKAAWFRRLLLWLGVGVLVFPVLFLLEVGIVARSSSSVSEAEIGRPRPVVLVIFDELSTLTILESEHEIDRRRFPHFARLAESSTWYRNATTVAQNTVSAVPAILTGRYPPDDVRSPDRSDHPENLFALLEGAMPVHAIERSTNLCGTSCAGDRVVHAGRWRRAIADGAAVYLALVLPEVGPPVSSNWSGFWRSRAEPASASSVERKQVHPARAVERFLAGISEAPAASLHVLHLGLPHPPWQFLPDGTEYYSREPQVAHGVRRSTWWAREWEVVQGQQRHLLQSGYADTLLGEILDGLEAAGLWEESVLIVTSDHGAAFQRKRPRRAIQRETLMEVAYVPLFLKRPGQREGGVDDRNALTIDVLPTVAELLEIALPWPVDGRSLLGSSRASTVKRIYRSHKSVGAGDEIRFPPHGASEWRAELGRMADRFPRASFYDIAPDGERLELLGTRPTGGEPVASFHAFLHDLDRGPGGSTVIPVHLEGELRPASELRGATRLAIALDGVIRAITETYTQDGGKRWRFSALVDPEHFPSDGNPRVDLFWLGRAGRARPRPIPIPQLE